METAVQIDFQEMEPVEHIRGGIAKHLSDLETRFGRVTIRNQSDQSVPSEPPVQEVELELHRF